VKNRCICTCMWKFFPPCMLPCDDSLVGKLSRSVRLCLINSLISCVSKYRRASVSADSVSELQLSTVYWGVRKSGKLNKYTVHKFQNTHQVRTGRNVVKYSSSNMSSTGLTFLSPCTYAETAESLPFICARERKYTKYTA
jgi:hypothetical protein